MLALNDSQRIPRLKRTRDGGAGAVRAHRLFGCANTVAANKRAGTVSVRPQVRNADVRPCVEFCGGFGQFGCVLTGRGGALQRDPVKQFADEGFYVGVCKVLADGGWLWARAAGVQDAAGVGGSAGRWAHWSVASGAYDESGEEAWAGLSAGGAGGELLRGLEYGGFDNWWVRCVVGVFAYGEFSEVDAVAEQVPDACGGHALLPGDAGDAVAADLRGVDRAHSRGVRVRDKPAGVGVAVVPERGLSALPHPSPRGVFTQLFEPVGVFFAFTFGVRQQHRSQEPPVAGAGVKVFGGANDPAPGGFDAIPCLELFADVSAEPGQVCDDYGLVFPRFDAFDSSKQARALFQGEPAGYVQLWREQDDARPVKGCAGLDRGDLVAVGVYVVGAGDSPAHVADADDARPGFGHWRERTRLRQAVAPGFAVDGYLRGWRNWSTQSAQDRPPERACGFESHPAHYNTTEAM